MQWRPSQESGQDCPMIKNTRATEAFHPIKDLVLFGHFYAQNVFAVRLRRGPH